MGVPFLFHTSVAHGVEEEVPHVPIILKPSLPHQVVAAVVRLRKRLR
jgi:hypothetical protein